MFFNRGNTSFIIRPFISCGTPGNETTYFFIGVFLNTPFRGLGGKNIPGAVPLAL